MDYDKKIIENLIGIEDWSTFEEFIHGLYQKNSNAIEVIKNYKTKGKSGRNREVDVLVKLGIVPHIITLGIECKYWINKVDGDVIDVVKAKKDDLLIDKFAVITTVGFELGADLYAKENGIDLFIVRPISDDDFGYSGRFINFRFHTIGSLIADTGIQTKMICEHSKEAESAEKLKNKISQMRYSPKDEELDPLFNLYEFNEIPGPNNSLQIQRTNLYKNMSKVIFDIWKKNNENFYFGKEFSFNQKVLFKKKVALFIDNLVVIINEVNFRIRYIDHYWEMTIDRGKFHPVVLENIIEQSITPIRKNQNDTEDFKFENTVSKQVVDLSQKPCDAIGRDGVDIRFLFAYPIDFSDKNKSSKYSEFLVIDSKPVWKQVYE